MKIVFEGIGNASREQLESNIRYAESLGLPKVQAGEALGRRLAVVGGGPSINEHISELQQFDGNVWAINRTFLWCRKYGINATFFTIDPNPIAAGMCIGARKAVLPTCVATNVFDELRNFDVRVFALGENGLVNGPTTATAVPALAAFMGYETVTFYGCESCVTEGGMSHAYCNANWPLLLRIRTSAGEFLTEPELIMQAEYLSAVMRHFPAKFKERSGGMLRAFISDSDWDCFEMSQALSNRIATSQQAALALAALNDQQPCLA